MKAYLPSKLVVPLVALAILFAGCRRKVDDADTITMGVVTVLTGDGANYGKAAKTAIDLAVGEINKEGGIKGKKLKVIYEDSKGDSTGAVNAFNKLVTVDKVPVIVGPFYSSQVLACAPVAERSKVVLMTGSATSDNIRDAGDYVFRVCPSNVAQARTVAEFAVKKLSAKTAYILYRNVDYGITLRDPFMKHFPGLGGKVLGADGIEADSSDVRAQLTKVKAASPDIIFAPVHYTEGGAMLRQARELAVPGTVVGTDGGFDPQLIKIAGPAAEGSYWCTIGWGDPTTKQVTDEFVKRYKGKYGEQPGVYSGLYYDAAKVVAHAMAEAKSITGPGIKRALYQVKNYKGATGITSFDRYGDVEKPYSIYQVKSGQFNLVE